MRRIVLAAVLAAVTMAPAAQATHDRTDLIPYSVGPADFRSYFVNDAANLPPGVTKERWLAVARRSLERWGGTFAGTTTASPDAGDDGINVIGFSNSSKLAGSVVGLNSKSKGGTLRTPGGGETCAVAPNMGTTQSVTTVPSVLRFRLRSDRVRKKRVRKRTLTVQRTVSTPRIDSAPVSGQRCLNVQPGTESDPATVKQESDVLIDATVTGWFAGPGVPPGDKLDLETVLLHELGHAAGLSHQPQNCDPSTPMRPSGGSGEYWRGLDEVLYASPCTAPYPATPDPAHGAEAAFPGGSLGGRSFYVNKAVPKGYDAERFAAVVQRAVERWGGVLAGTTDAKPTQGDGVSVIGFDTIARTNFELTTRTEAERLVFPAYRTCSIVAGPVPSYRVKKVTKKVKVRVKGRRKTLKLRRDKLVQTSVTGPATGQCADHAAENRPGTTTVETDLGIAHEMDAYEMGPLHPVLTTRVDMATMLANALGQAAGIAPAACGSTATPVTATVLPGDWWHTPTDLNRVTCPPPARAAARPEPASGPVRYVQVRD
jgi:hypothetical protein